MGTGRRLMVATLGRRRTDVSPLTGNLRQRGDAFPSAHARYHRPCTHGMSRPAESPSALISFVRVIPTHIVPFFPPFGLQDILASVKSPSRAPRLHITSSWIQRSALPCSCCSGPHHATGSSFQSLGLLRKDGTELADDCGH